MKIEEFKIKDYTRELSNELVAKDSLLNDFEFTDNIDFDEQYEGVPFEKVISGVLGTADTNEGLQIRVDKANKVSYFQSRNFVSGASGIGWRLDSNGALEASSGTFRGALAATSGTIGGWTIGATTISSAATEERIILDQGNKRVELYNSSGNVVYRLRYGTLTTDAYQLISIQNDARRGLEFIVGATLGGDAKCITIDNPSTSISIDMTDAGSTGINIVGASTSGITITHGGTGAGINVSASGSAAGAITVGGGDYPSLDITQNGAATNSYGIRITQDANALKEGILIDCNANSQLTEGMTIDRDGSADNQIIVALRIESANAGVGGAATGIDFTGATIQSIFNVAADTTAIGTAAGRIPIYVAGTLKYLAYYNA